jgi:hypothetical protein
MKLCFAENFMEKYAFFAIWKFSLCLLVVVRQKPSENIGW